MVVVKNVEITSVEAIEDIISQVHFGAVLLKQGFFSFQALASRASSEGAVLSFEGLQAALPFHRINIYL